MISIAFACANQVFTLENGDRISGEFVKELDGKIVVRSNLFGEISLPKSSIKSGIPPQKNETPKNIAPKSETKIEAKPAVAKTEVKKPEAKPVAEKPEVAKVEVAKADTKVDEPKKKKPFDLREALHIPKGLTGNFRVRLYQRSWSDNEEESVLFQPHLSYKTGKHAFDWTYYYYYRKHNDTWNEEWIKSDDKMWFEQKYRYNFNKVFFSQSRTFLETDQINEIDPRRFSRLVSVFILSIKRY